MNINVGNISRTATEQDLEGRPLTVNEARPRPTGPARAAAAVAGAASAAVAAGTDLSVSLT